MSQKWTLRPGEGIASLSLKDIPDTELSAGQARVALKAFSLNARDLMVANGISPVETATELVPLSDAAGVVEEVASDVTDVSVGDRVVVTFNPRHQSGAFESYMGAFAHGEVAQGVLARHKVFEARALVRLPDNVSFEQAATLPCAAVTAWNALFEAGHLKPGQTVFATGTGSVSLIALLLAKVAGARVGISSSDPAKLEHAEALGADFGVNYLERPNWDAAVREATEEHGAEVVVETAGPPSIATAVRAAAQNGTVAQIGLKGMEGPAVSMLDLVMSGVRVVPIMVGSRTLLERVVAAVSRNAVKIPVHQRFDFGESPAAFSALQSGDAFGKVTITID
ncbi:MAG: NAD(P)-dependent alcohol dehydrogenase [Pseudomonadota bacterium]